MTTTVDASNRAQQSHRHSSFVPRAPRRLGRLGLATLLVAASAVVLTPGVANAAVIENFTAEYDKIIYGDHILVANSNVECITQTTPDRWDADNDGDTTEFLVPIVGFSSPTTLIAGCLTDQSRDTVSGSTPNDYRWMVFSDVDGDASTFNSSSITVTIPTGATVEFARLYWHGNALGAVDNATNFIDDVKFDTADPTGAPLGEWPACNAACPWAPTR